MNSGKREVFMSFLHIWLSLLSSFSSLFFGSFSSFLSGLSICLQGFLNQIHSVHMLSAIRPRRSYHHFKSSGPARYNFLESWSVEASKRFGHSTQVLLALPLDVKLKLFDPVYLATSHWSVLATHINSISPLILSQSFGSFKDMIWVDRLDLGYIKKRHVKWKYKINTIKRIQLVQLICYSSQSSDVPVYDINQMTNRVEVNRVNSSTGLEGQVSIIIYDTEDENSPDNYRSNYINHAKNDIILPMKVGKKMIGKTMYFMRIIFSEAGRLGQFNLKKNLPAKVQNMLENPNFLDDFQIDHTDVHEQIHRNMKEIRNKLKKKMSIVNQMGLVNSGEGLEEIRIEPDYNSSGYLGNKRRFSRGLRRVEPCLRMYQFDNDMEIPTVDDYLRQKIEYIDVDLGERDFIKTKFPINYGIDDSLLNIKNILEYDRKNSKMYNSLLNVKNNVEYMKSRYGMKESKEEEEVVEIVRMPNLETGKLYFTLLTSVIREVAL
uniref:Uncharacterized protein n=1 Tax=Theileria annulata TaxID=5874 RepID=A0A3B0MF82_THEAN